MNPPSGGPSHPHSPHFRATARASRNVLFERIAIVLWFHRVQIDRVLFLDNLRLRRMAARNERAFWVVPGATAGWHGYGSPACAIARHLLSFAIYDWSIRSDRVEVRV